MVLQGSEIIEDFRSSSRHGGHGRHGGHRRHGGHKGSTHRSRRMPHSGNGYSRWGGHGGKRSHCGGGRCGNNNYGNYGNYGNFDQYSYPAFFSSAPFLGYAYADYYPYEFGQPTIPYYTPPVIQVQENIRVQEEEPVGQVVHAVNEAENRIITNLVLFAILGACVYMIIKK